MVALSRNVSNKHAMELLLTGDMIGAAKSRADRFDQSRSQCRRSDKLTAETMALAAKDGQQIEHDIGGGQARLSI